MKLNVPFKITYLKLIKLLGISSTCTTNKTNYYFGCLRSRTERQLWHDITAEQQLEVLRLIAGRKLRIELMRLRKNEQLGFDFEEDVEMGELF